VFISENLSGILKNLFDWDINIWWFGKYVSVITGLFCFLVYTPLCWVRKIEKFAIFHLFADAMILTTIIVVVIYTTLQFKEQDWELGEGLQPINLSNFLSFIGKALNKL
jgi:amino acid permease